MFQAHRLPKSDKIEYIDVGDSYNNRVLYRFKVKNGNTLVKNSPPVFTGAEFTSFTIIDEYGLSNVFSRNASGKISFPNLTTIKKYGLYYTFYDSDVSSVSFPKLTTVEESGMEYSFCSCENITGSLTFPKLKTIKSGGFSNAFSSTNITSVSFPELTTIGEDGNSTYGYMYGMAWGFSNCENLQSVSFPKLSSVKKAGLHHTFRNCPSLTTVSFPSLSKSGTSITGDDYNSNPLFECFMNSTNITSVHLPASFRDKSQYLTKEILFGNNYHPNLQILFDL